MDERLKTALVSLAQGIVAHRGIDALITHHHYPSACGCLGPRDGDPLCSCGMSAALEHHLVEVANELDPQAALTIMRVRLVVALGGGRG